MPTILSKHTRTSGQLADPVVRGSEVDRYFRGPGSQALAKVAEKIRQHLQDHYERGMAAVEAPPEIDERPIPPNRTFSVRVRYRYRGPGEPLPFPAEDE